METLDKRQKLDAILHSSGWYPGRSIKSEVENSPIYLCYPKKIKDFIDEYGNLEVSYKGETIKTLGIVFFKNINLYKLYDDYLFELSQPINIANNDNEYYYSKLIGKFLFSVAGLTENNELLMDEDGRFYIYTFIPEFFWIANNPMDAFAYLLLLGENNTAILDEESLKWLPPVGKELICELPINKELTKNPWLD